MNAVDIFKKCQERGIRLHLHGADLRVAATHGRLDEQLKQLVREHKQALIDLLQSQSVDERTSAGHAGGGIVLSLAQERLWFQYLYDGDSAVYNIPLVVESAARVDEAAMLAALRQVVARHEPLRTVIANHDGSARAHVLDASDFVLECHGEIADDAPLRAQLADAQTSRPFDLSADFMLRAALLHRAGAGSLLYLTLHHIAADGASIQLLLHELDRAYTAATGGAEPLLAPLAQRFSDHASWEREQLQGERLQRHLDHWLQRLAGVPVLHRFPLDNPRPPTADHAGGRLRFGLDPDTSERLKQLASAHDTTLFTLIQAAFAVFIARYSDTDDVVFGTPVANRNLPGSSGLVGYFAQLVPVRAKIDGSASFAQVLADVRDRFVEDMPHHHVPNAMIVDALAIARQPNANPLLQLVLVYEESGVGASAGEATTALVRTAVERGDTGSKFDLALIARHGQSGLTFAWEYASALFDAATPHRLAANFLHLLQGISQAMETPVGRLQLLAEQESIFLSQAGTGAALEIPSKSVHALFEQYVRQTPDAPAVVHSDGCVTYAMLDASANALAWRLIDHGVGRGDMVGICLEHPRLFPLAALAVMKAGAAYLPLDPRLPPRRIAHVIDDSRARLWLVDGDALAAHGDHIQLLDVASPAIPMQSSDRPAPGHDVRADDLAYVIYTSGSTGAPKGTLLEHAGAVNLAIGQRALLGLEGAAGRHARILQFSSVSFDAATWELLMALCNGGALVVPDPAVKQDPPALAALIAQQRVTHATLPPAYLSSLQDGALDGLSHLLVGGEAIGRADARRWMHGRTFYNAYGPTEATVCATLGVYAGEDRVHMGRPLPNYRCAVLDDHGNRVPVGVLGELHVGGVGLARGYHGQPALTAERFVTLGVDGAQAERWYRTGDLVRWLPSGNLEYVGRRDNQIKIRGFRVELGEIEAALSEHPDIAAAHARTWQDAHSASVRIVVYYQAIGTADAEGARTRIRQFLEERLPDYMVPMAYVPLAALPLTAHGKIDAAALPSPAEADLAQNGYVTPATATQRLVCSVLGELLGNPRIGIRDSFFAMGGDSILSIRAVARINAHGHRLTSRQFFDARTVEGIASVLDANASAGRQDDAGPSRGVLQPLPIQQRFLALGEGFDDRYLQSLLLHVPAAADAAFFRRFLHALFARHDMLRLRMRRDGDAGTALWFQEPEEAEPGSALTVVRLQSADEAGRSREIEQAGEACKAGIRLESGPLFAMLLLEAEQASQRRLLVVFHHFIVDGVSWRIFLDDLKLAFAQHVRAEPVALPLPGTRYQQWAQVVGAWQERTTWAPVTDAVASDRTWTGTAAGPETLADSVTATAVLAADATRALLQDCNRAYRTRIDDLLLAALGTALHEWRGITEQDVFLETHGRDEELAAGVDLGHCLGWFTSLYPLRLHMAGGSAEPAELIRRIKEARRAEAHLGLAFLQGENLHVHPEILFNYLGQFDQQLSAGRDFSRAPEFTGHDVDRRRRRDAMLVFNGRVVDGELVFHLDASGVRFTQQDADDLAACFAQALQRVVAHCSNQPLSRSTPSDFPLCTVAQEDLDRWQEQFGELEDVYPATGSQLGMLYHAQLEGGRGYLTQNVMRFERDFDPAAFRQAWQWVVARHAALRTIFVGLDREQPLQLVLAQAAMEWHQQLLEPAEAAVQQHVIDERLRRDYLTPLDERRAPLARFSLLHTAEGQAVFAWTCSHAILDGWSLGIVYREVIEAYEALRAGRAPRPQPVTGFRRYVEWAGSRDREAATAFWTEELSGLVADAGIGIEAPAQPVAPGKDAIGWSPSADDLDAMRRYAAAHDVAISTLVQAAWLYLLARYRGTDEAITGMTLSGRPAELAEVEAVVGMLVNTVPLAARIPRGQDVANWLQTLQQRQQLREGHGHLPLAEIVKLAGAAQDGTLFSSVLGFHSQPVGQAASAMRRSGAKGGVSNENTHYPLVLGVSPHEGLHFTLTYETSRFDRAAMLRLRDHLQAVLRALISPHVRTIADIEMLAPAELAELAALAEGAPLQRPAPLLPHWLRSNAQQRGAQPAVLLEDQALDHAGLDARSNQFARALVAVGVRPGDRVGVCQQRTLDMVASVLGTLKAGAVYVPLDPGYPDARLAFLLADAGIGHVLAEEWLAAQLPLSGQTVVAVEAADAQSAAAFDSPVTRASAAYMIHTSGSTGQPKGVLVEHGALADKLAALAQQYGLGEDERGLLFASMSFDASLSQLLAPLCVGGSVVLRPDGMSEPEAVLAHVRAQRVTWLHVVPAYLRQLLEVDDWSGTALRRVSCGGDVLDRGLQQAWFGAGRAGIALYNSYGPTEITITASVHEVDAAQAVVPIGRPLPGVRYWVLDGQGRVLPRGAVGELCIGGRSLARGYWNRSELSGERFVALEPLPGRGERMYRSGDRVRWNAAGELEFVGRSDHQVKVRGHRIELGEVEAALQACPGVAAAVVKVEQDSLWAYVELAGSTAGQVEAALAERLPAHLLPSGYEVVGEWPLTRSGKRDRAALVRGQGTAALRRGPSTAVEQALLEIWTALLKREDIAVTDNFFQKGGHSLLATRLASQIRRRFEVAFTLKSLFELPSIEEQAALVLAQRSADASGDARLPTIPRLQHDRPVPLSFAQKSLWLMDQMEGGNAGYIAGTSLTVKGRFVTDAAERAFSSIIARHQVLRSIIREHESGPMQTVTGAERFRVEFVDLSQLPLADASSALERISHDARTRRFDLSSDLMLRVHVVRQASDLHTLLVHMHHIACDGWSVGLLMGEFNTLYRMYSASAATDDAGELPSLPIQYRDYAQWQQECLSGSRLDALVDYWKRRLEGIPELHGLPVDLPRPPRPSFRGSVHRQQLDAGIAAMLSRACHAQGATFFMGMHAAFAAWLARYCGQDDVVVGTAVANREQSEVASLIGFFSNTLVLRTPVRPQQAFNDLLSQVKQQDIADFDHQQLPFPLLTEHLNPERHLDRHPLFQIVLNVDNNDVERLQVPGSNVQGRERGSYESNFDLTLYAVEQADGIKLLWRYATDLFTPATIARMADSFQTLLQAAVADPAAPVQALPMVGEAELAELADLAEGAPLQRPAPLLPHWLRSNAQQRGAQPAVLLEDQALDHAGLDARSNQFARALVAAGVRPGDRVGVCQQRTLDMVASVLGTLKAGAVYVPLDPGYPDARLAFLLADAGIGHVLAETAQAIRLPLSGQTVVAVEAADAQSAAAFDSPVTRASAAYMIHTSGSTGQPKGVLVEHGALADKLAALAQQYGLGEDERGLLFASMSFDASLSQLLAPLCVGGSVVLRPDGMSEPEAVLAHVRAQRVTWLHVVPAYLRQLLEVDDWSGTALRRVSCGGDVLDRGLQQAWFGAGRVGIALYNSYGPTEITITASVHEVDAAQAVVPIGRPLPGVRYWVLDGQGRVLPRGAVGELCIGGRSLARGYWNRPELSGERFVALEPLPGRVERMYRSGDRVRWNAAGELEFVGRSDHQVKVRGHRIELGEVEAALQACPGVAAAVVKVEQDSLWAYVELAGSTAGQVEAALAERLPAHLLPSGYEVVGEWPLTRSGKRDRAALVRGQGAAALRRGPSTAVEQALLEIWTALLKREDIAVTDNFFQKGGHSLLATRLASQIRRRFEVAFTLKSLFELPSIEEQARMIATTKEPGQQLATEQENAMEEFDV
ncbi:non-ribosomal peptide synthetase [Xanthomonas sp. 1678]|uniref:non-ribosomal peptide synthetase n=1 Tax=Xanthomonas sp. 1678 TaxID=3158788 RepID=UPI002864C140|nr:amino acid adenylation domain-containing protein/non-ribosomal peptide synthase protein (TIGR01720 family) [Xanthomonas translucens]